MDRSQAFSAPTNSRGDASRRTRVVGDSRCALFQRVLLFGPNPARKFSPVLDVLLSLARVRSDGQLPNLRRHPLARLIDVTLPVQGVPAFSTSARLPPCGAMVHQPLRGGSRISTRTTWHGSCLVTKLRFVLKRSTTAEPKEGASTRMNWALSLALIAAAVIAYARLPFLHPVPLWLTPWSIVALLYSLDLLPYVRLSTATVILVVSGSAAFIGGSILGDAWSDASRRETPHPPLATGEPQAWPTSRGGCPCCHHYVRPAGCVLDASVSLVWRVRQALLSSQDVRFALGEGTAGLTIKYIYFAFAASSLCAFSRRTLP